ncbi:MAG: TIGR00269 family protein [Sulfolobales archaeon]|nr:TIGR00269 family protein [Sulfolobales archaeon]MCX8199401.1 TIGR00269 family protein [Sulfolobales archaeon]MDW8170285.1 TIGR00269 family protein [Desulfurococcaceae archaeon]
MANCSICSKQAIYVIKSGGLALCKKHFLEYFDRKVRRTIRKNKLFRKNEHIVIAVSGGKDSLSLLHYTVNLSKRARMGWRITALTIDEGISGYRDYTIKRVEELSSSLGVELKIASFKDYFGYTLDEVVKISGERGLPYLPCTYCGVFRRYLLNRVAREISGTVLATAHHLDDVVQTYLINIFNNNWSNIHKLTPSLTSIHKLFVRRVKPFYEVLEKETTLYAILNGLYPSERTECPYAPLSFRWQVRRVLNYLEESRPGLKYSTMKSLMEATSLKNVASSEAMTCIVCGEPSSHEVCKACQLRAELGLLELREVKT